MSMTILLSYASLAIFAVIFIKFTFLNFITKAKKTWLPTFRNRNGRSVWSIPGPLSIPFLGTKWILLLRYQLSKLHEAYADLNKKYGSIVLEVTPDGIPIVHLFSRADIEKVLRYPSKYPFRPPTEIVAMYRQSRPDRYASAGITNEQGEVWYNLRSKLTPHITSPRILQLFLPALNDVCNDFIELLRVKRDPDTLVVRDFQDIANLMGLEAVCTLMLGQRMGFLSKEPEENIIKLAAAVKQLFISQRDSYYGLGLWKYFPTKTYRDFVRSEETIYNIVSDLVDKSLNDVDLEEEDENSNRRETKTANTGNDVKSVFHEILQEEGLDIREKKSAIVDFIAAGIETLANTLTFALSYIISHDSALENIFKEFQDCEDYILQENLSKAIYTKACLQETYRIHPTAFCLARILEEDTSLSGYNLCTGTVVLCQTMISCRKEENFKNASQFEPNRWLEKRNHCPYLMDEAAFVPSKNTTITTTEASSSLCSPLTTKATEGGTTCPVAGATTAGASSIVVPFGVGKRTCPGKRFVEMELLILIAKMVKAFRIDFESPMETVFEFLLAPKTPVNLILRDRI